MNHPPFFEQVHLLPNSSLGVLVDSHQLHHRGLRGDGLILHEPQRRSSRRGGMKNLRLAKDWRGRNGSNGPAACCFTYIYIYVCMYVCVCIIYTYIITYIQLDFDEVPSSSTCFLRVFQRLIVWQTLLRLFEPAILIWFVWCFPLKNIAWQVQRAQRSRIHPPPCLPRRTTDPIHPRMARSLRAWKTRRWHGTGYSTAHGPLHSMMSARHCTAPWSSAEHPFHQVLTQRHAWNPRHSKWNLPKAPKFGLGRSLGAVARWVQSKRHRRHSQFWCLMGLMDGLWSPHPGHPCLELTRWELRSDLHTQSCHQHRPTRSLRFQERCYHLTARITSLYPNQNSTKYANVCKELGGLVLKTRDKFQSFKTVPERMQSRHIKTSNPVLKVDDDNSSALN